MVTYSILIPVAVLSSFSCLSIHGCFHISFSKIFSKWNGASGAAVSLSILLMLLLLQFSHSSAAIIFIILLLLFFFHTAAAITFSFYCCYNFFILLLPLLFHSADAATFFILLMLLCFICCRIWYFSLPLQFIKDITKHITHTKRFHRYLFKYHKQIILLNGSLSLISLVDPSSPFER